MKPITDIRELLNELRRGGYGHNVPYDKALRVLELSIAALASAPSAAALMRAEDGEVARLRSELQMAAVNLPPESEAFKRAQRALEK